MKHYLLPAEAKAATGFTDLFVVTHEDLTVATDNTDQALVLDQLAGCDVVGHHCLIEIVEAFDAAAVSADNALTVSLGVTGALTTFIGASALAAAGVGTAARTGYVPAAAGVAFAALPAGTNLIANFDITDADGALADYSTGKLHIWVNISRQSVRGGIQA